MDIKLIVTDHQLAKSVMLPIQSISIILNESGLEIGSIEWGDVEVERGAIETVFEILGTLHLGSMAAGVASGVLANWLWSHLHKPSEVRVEIINIHNKVANTINIETHSMDSMKASLSKVIELQNDENIEK
jgi:hypothetical protein